MCDSIGTCAYMHMSHEIVAWGLTVSICSLRAAFSTVVGLLSPLALSANGSTGSEGMCS